MIDVLKYEHSDQDVQDTASAAIEYIIGGDAINSVFDISGLLVYGVISALREHDDLLYGPNSSLSPEETARLAEVEDVVDTAVKDGMQFYPFGEFIDKRKIDVQTRKRLGAEQRDHSEFQRSRRNKADVRLERIARREDVKSTDLNGPVTSYSIDEIK
jgi:hypothetical protein